MPGAYAGVVYVSKGADIGSLTMYAVWSSSLHLRDHVHDTRTLLLCTASRVGISEQPSPGRHTQLRGLAVAFACRDRKTWAGQQSFGAQRVASKEAHPNHLLLRLAGRIPGCIRQRTSDSAVSSVHLRAPCRATSSRGRDEVRLRFLLGTDATCASPGAIDLAGGPAPTATCCSVCQLLLWAY